MKTVMFMFMILFKQEVPILPNKNKIKLYKQSLLGWAPPTHIFYIYDHFYCTALRVSHCTTATVQAVTLCYMNKISY